MAGDPQPLTPEQIEQTREKKPQTTPRKVRTAKNDAELGRRRCDQGWGAERLAATPPGGRHDALASFMGHYRATTTAEQWPQVLDYLLPAFLVAKPEGVPGIRQAGRILREGAPSRYIARPEPHTVTATLTPILRHLLTAKPRRRRQKVPNTTP